MKINCSSLHRRPSWLALAIIWLASILALHAQATTGTIEGRVSNRATDEYLEKARIAVEGTPLSTSI